MKELHARGETIEEMEEVLKRVPVHPRIVQAIKSAHALGYVSFKYGFFLYFFAS